jgi:hypothetical protein
MSLERRIARLEHARPQPVKGASAVLVIGADERESASLVIIGGTKADYMASLEKTRNFVR